MQYLKVLVEDEVILEGKLYDKITVDECAWTIETDRGQRLIDIDLVKWPKSMKWWDNVVEGEPKIDC